MQFKMSSAICFNLDQSKIVYPGYIGYGFTAYKSMPSVNCIKPQAQNDVHSN